MIFRHLLNMRSHPTWVRGLKHAHTTTNEHLCVAPYVGAWIETCQCQGCRDTCQSHPTWVRGLKLSGLTKYQFQSSRTLRGCVD